MQTWGTTDRGCVRKNNQDAMYHRVTDSGAFGLVCDGMGGAAAGDTASRLASETFVREFDRTEGTVEERMLRALRTADDAVCAYAEEHPECQGMGTTLVAASVCGDTATILNVGDSRCYYAEPGKIRQITEDHSVVAELMRRGTITREEARVSRYKNYITRVVGSEHKDQGDIFVVRMHPGSVLLLCSDGLSNQVSDEEMERVLYQNGPMEQAGRSLVELALHRGAPDNVTVVLLAAIDPET